MNIDLNHTIKFQRIYFFIGRTYASISCSNIPMVFAYISDALSYFFSLNKAFPFSFRCGMLSSFSFSVICHDSFSYSFGNTTLISSIRYKSFLLILLFYGIPDLFKTIVSLCCEERKINIENH